MNRVRTLLALTGIVCAMSGRAGAQSSNTPSPFAQGTWVTPVYVSGTLANPQHMIELHGGVGYHIIDNLSINLEGVANPYTNVNAPAGEYNTGSIGFDLLARWHFLTGENWSLYVDGGAGLREFLDGSFPNIASHFNFTPQVGVGATLKLWDHAHLMGGIRAFHLSNAGLTSDNPGYTAAQIYLGCMIQW